MDEKYITEYSTRGALLDLSKYDIDTSKLDEAALNAGKSEDGLTGIAAGINAAMSSTDMPTAMKNSTTRAKRVQAMARDRMRWRRWRSFSASCITTPR